MSTRSPTLILALICMGSAACTPSSPPPPPSSGSAAVRAGARPFAFDETAVTDLLIAKNDPTTGDRWSARFKKGADGLWRISSGPEDAPLVDKWADSTFLEHLLSTLLTLEVQETGISATLDTAGLAIPRYSLVWSTPDASFELRVGTEASLDLGTYASFPGLSGDAIHRVKGATLPMLANIKNFDHLRYRRLSTWDVDQVQEFEIDSGPRKSFYAQRQSGDWADEGNQMYSGPVGEWILRLTQLLVMHFEDQTARSAQRFKEISKKPLYRVVLKDRLGASQDLMIALDPDGAWWGCSTLRPGAVFRMDPDVAGYFLPPRVTKKHSKR